MTITLNGACPRFTLRTLFVVVTVFGVWLGWNHYWVRQRDILRERILSAGGVVEDRVALMPGRSMPVVWSHFGAKPTKTILLDSFSKQDVREVEDRFPEAEVASESPYLHLLRNSTGQAYNSSKTTVEEYELREKEKLKVAKLAEAVNEARNAGIDVTADELDDAGWEPGDDLAAIRMKLGRP